MQSTPRLALALASLALIQCGGRSHGGDAAPAPNLSSTANASSSVLSLFMAPKGKLVGDPNLMSVTLRYKDGTVVERSGEMPQDGQFFRGKDLPPGQNVLLAVNLYHNNVMPSARTHECEADEYVQLEAGQEASATVTCRPVASDATAGGTVVFVKTSRLKIDLDHFPVLLGAKNWDDDRAFSSSDNERQKVSVRQVDGRLYVRLGGAIEYVSAPEGEAALRVLSKGGSLSLIPTAGRVADKAETATFTLTDDIYGLLDPKSALAALPFNLTTPSQTIGATGTVVEEDMKAEFTVASYNVENFFDQTDDAANAGYGDYRITPNAQGQDSNWGDGADFEGSHRSFTEIKALGIRKVLTAIEPHGPAVVGLVEVESQKALDTLFDAVKDLGYTAAYMADVPATVAPTAVHTAILSKFPVKEAVAVLPQTPVTERETMRAIVRAKLDVGGHDLYVYVNHWKSKGGGESLRIVSAQAVADDIAALQAKDPLVDYVVMGDLNSNYNEAVTIEPRNNDTNGRTGLNHVLKAQGDELKVAKATAGLNYNLHYELRYEERRTAWYPEFGWGSLDNMVIGPGMYDSRGVSYVDNSFRVASPKDPAFAFLFDAEGHPKRWNEERQGNHTVHTPGGFSDHLPIFARFQVKRKQDEGRIWLFQPGVPDPSDKRAGN